MHGYGLPRHITVEFPDVADGQTYGLKFSKTGNKQNSKRKNASRRVWKKKERNRQKNENQKLLDDLEEIA